MKDSKNFIQNKYKGDKAELDIKHILESSGYKVRKFGIEQNYQKIIDMIKFNRESDSNRRLLHSPDFVVVDPENNEAKFVEVKIKTNITYFNEEKTKIWFNRGAIEDYSKLWGEVIIVVVISGSPWVLCVNTNDIDQRKHLVEVGKDGEGKLIEKWKFKEVYKEISDVFPKVNKKLVQELYENKAMGNTENGRKIY